MRRKHTEQEWAQDLFTLYEQKMYRVALAVLHDEAWAEDAVMDAFERLVKAGRTDLAPQSEDMRRLVIKVVQSTSIDIYRKHARECARIAYPGDEVLASCDAAAPVEDDIQQAKDLIAGLPESYSAVLEQRFVQDRSVAQTADALGISQANVRKRQERGLKLLRKNFEGEKGGLTYGLS